ncbi:MAG: winged helix-turn-helix domain-containing protein [Armatimonadota bacterium]
MNVSDELQQLRNEVRLLHEAVANLAPLDQSPGKGQLSLASVLEDLDEQFAVQLGSPDDLDALESELGNSLPQHRGIAVIIGGLIRGYATSRWYRASAWPGSDRMPRPDIEKLIEPLSHSNRIALLFELSSGPQTTGQLQEATGMSGGQFYHHLNRLIDAGFVSRLEQGKFSVSSRAKVALATLVALHSVLEDWPEEAGERRARETMNRTHAQAPTEDAGDEADGENGM